MTDAPRRRHSPAVYRRRRLVVLVAVIAVAAAVWILVAQPWRGSAADGPDPAPSLSASSVATMLPAPSATVAAESPAPTPAETPIADAPTPTQPAVTAAACTSADVTVDAVTDQSSYPSGQSPKLSIRLTNHGDQDCTLNVGTTTQILTVTSGQDTWWRSTDCQSEPSDMIVLLPAGQTVSSVEPVTWDRTRSSVSTCDSASRPRAPGGGASYHLSVSIGGIASSGTAQFMLY